MENETDTTKPEKRPARAKAAKMRAKAKAGALKIRDGADRFSEWFLHTRFFTSIVDWAFRVCDVDKKNHISSEQLYSGLLLVHINLAKYFGSAACMPPSRLVVQDLFEASDVDDSGGIDREEFNIIVKVSCAQIFGRVMINYATLILVIPFVAKLIVDRYLDPESIYLETICIQFTGIFLFVVIIPTLWKLIDQVARIEAGRQASQQKSERGLQSSLLGGAGLCNDEHQQQFPSWLQPASTSSSSSRKEEPTDKKDD